MDNNPRIYLLAFQHRLNNLYFCHKSRDRGKFGSPGRARTADLVINSHPLYRLSYRGIVMDNVILTASLFQDMGWLLSIHEFLAEHIF